MLFIFQDGRIYGSPDGVKSIATSVNFFFTRSRLSSYINHTVGGFRLMLVLAVFFAISITASFAQDTVGDYKSVGSGNWDVLATWARYNGSTWITSPVEGWPGQNAGTGAITIQSVNNVTIAGNLTTNPVGTVTIDGTLTFSGDWTFNLITSQLTITAGLIPTAKIVLTNKSELKLPTGATIYVTNGGIIGACSNNTQIYIGLNFFACTGGGGSIGNFNDLYAPTVITSTPAARCGTGTVNLGATSSGGSTISWFATSTGGASLATGTSFTTPIIYTTTTYYAEAKNTITEYVSDPRTAVLATIDTNPTITLTSGVVTNTQTICVSTPITPITYVVGGGATGATVTGLPAGVTGNYSSGVYTISGSPSVSGTFNYTVTTTGSGTCTNATASGTITSAAGIPPTSIGAIICQGGSGSLTSSFTCPAGGGSLTSGLTYAGIGESVNSPGTITWSSPGNITSSVGNLYATSFLHPSENSEYLQGKNYGFAIPANATIKGITVSIKRQSDYELLGFGIYDVGLNLLKNNATVGTPEPYPGSWPISWQVVTYGGPSDLWGTTWTAAEINNVNFGASLSVRNNGIIKDKTAIVDYIQISVTYTLPPATLDWYTAPSGGTKIGSGTPFNPVGVASSGLVETNTPGTTTYYAECSTSPGCRTVTDFIITPSLPASVSIAAVPSGAICAGTSVKFTATPTNGGVTPTYQWKKGGVVIPSETSATYTSTTLADNDKITVEMTSNAVCASGNPATSNEITVSITPTVGIPVFTLGTTSTRYQILESVPYTATATNSTGITYSLDATSIAGGNSISALGVVTYSPTWSGPSTITATAAGCNGPTTAIHSVRTDWCFALFAGVGAIHNDLASTVTGDIGTNAGAVDGFSGSPAGTLIGQCHIADATTLQAKTDLNNLYATLDAKPCSNPKLGNILGNGQILTPGVYCIDPPASSLNGNLFLDAQGNPDAIFIIKVGGALSTAALSKVQLLNSASEKNVFWLIDGAVNLGANSLFQGTFIGTGAINLTAGSTLVGRGLTKVGAISLSNCTVNSICAPFTCMSDNIAPTFIAPAGPFEHCVESIISAAYVSNALQFNADPDAYIFKKDDTQFDLDPYKFADNCCVSNSLFPLNIRWTIDFITGQSSVSGTGQPSKYGSDISLWGDGVTFNPVVHKITWWIKDCSGNESLPLTRNITINPRPKVQ